MKPTRNKVLILFLILSVLGCDWHEDIRFATKYTNLKLLTNAKVVAVNNNQENFLTIVFILKKDDKKSFVKANKGSIFDCSQVSLTETLFDNKYKGEINKCTLCFIGVNKSWWGKLDENSGYFFLEIWYG